MPRLWFNEVVNNRHEDEDSHKAVQLFLVSEALLVFALGRIAAPCSICIPGFMR